MFGFSTGAFDTSNLEASADMFSYAGGALAGSELGGSASYSSAPDSVFSSGTFQQLSSTLLGYLGKRLDVDVQQRLYGHMPYPQQWGVNAGVSFTQQGVYPGAVRPQTQGGSVQLNGLLPWLLIGGVVYFVARRK